MSQWILVSQTPELSKLHALSFNGKIVIFISDTVERNILIRSVS
jgi:hypothetical protein